MKLSSVIVGTVIFIIIGVVAGGLYFVKRHQITAAMNQPAFEPPTAVTLTTAKTVQWYPTSDLVGTVIALRSVTVQNEVEGVVRSVGFQSGDVVEKDQVLVTLDDSTERAELNTEEAALRVAQAEVSVAETGMRLAEAELRMQETAAQSRATAAIEVTRARAELERTTAEHGRAKASVEEAKARVEKIKTRLVKHIIRAPFRARVGLRTVHEGQFLAQQMGSQGTPIATLQEIADTIYVDFAIPQEYLPRVQKGLSVEGQMDGVPGPEGRIMLTVVALDSSVNNATRNVRVRTVVDNKDQALRPGMFIKIRVPIDTPKPYVAVPVTAIRRASYSDQVYIIKSVEAPGPDGKPAPQMRASQRFVRLGPVIGDDVIVLDGLKSGEQIASDGSFKLRENALVMPAMPAGTPGSASPGHASDATPDTKPQAHDQPATAQTPPSGS